MVNELECPYCDGEAILMIENTAVRYHAEWVPIRQYFYRCQECEVEFTTTESDDATIAQLHNYDE